MRRQFTFGKWMTRGNTSAFLCIRCRASRPGCVGALYVSARQRLSLTRRADAQRASASLIRLSRPASSMRHRLAMTSSSKSPRDTIAIGRKHLLDQRLRIEKHKEFIGKLERDGQPNVIAEARRLLSEMEQTLARMQTDLHRKRHTGALSPRSSDLRRCRLTLVALRAVAGAPRPLGFRSWPIYESVDRHASHACRSRSGQTRRIR